MQTHDHGGAFISSFVTGIIVAIPEPWLSYAEKVISVFFLAVVAEVGRRLVNRVWTGGRNGVNKP